MGDERFAARGCAVHVAAACPRAQCSPFFTRGDDMAGRSSSILVLVGVAFVMHASPPAGAQALTTAALGSAPGTARVRSADAEALALIAEGIARSPTLARLVGEIDGSGLLVNVELSSFLPSAGDLTLVGGTSAFRYVRIRLRIPGTRLDTIAALGHELQHARELAAATSVRDSAGMRRLYQELGRGDWRGEHFETQSAQDVGFRVRDEVMKHAPPVSVAARD